MKEITPGPGTYTVFTTFKNAGKSLEPNKSKISNRSIRRYQDSGNEDQALRPQTSSNFISPGPGAYLQNLDKIYKDQRGTVIGHSKRKEMTPRDHANFPSPG